MSLITASLSIQTDTIDALSSLSTSAVKIGTVTKTGNNIVIGRTGTGTANSQTTINGSDSTSVGLNTQYLNALTNTGVINIGNYRNETGVVIGKTVPTYSITLNSDGGHPLKTNVIDTINTGDTLTIGSAYASQITVGSGINTVVVGDAFYIYNNTETNDAFLDVANTPASIYIGTNTEITPTGINIGQTGVTTTVKDNLTITNGTNTMTFATSSGRQLLLGDSAGVSGQILVSGGPTGDITWANGGFYVTGSIATPNATTRTLQAFGYTFTSTLAPKVYLTYDAGSASTSIVTTCLAGIDGVAGAWTGFYYLTSINSSAIVGSKLNWLASN